MNFLEKEYFLFETLDYYADLDRVLEEVDQEKINRTDASIARINKAQEILKEKILRTPGEGSHYLRQQHDLLERRKAKLLKHSHESQKQLMHAMHNTILQSEVQSPIAYDPDNKVHQNIIKSYHKARMEHARSMKTNEILKNVQEAVASPESANDKMALAQYKGSVRLAIAEKEHNARLASAIIRNGMNNMRINGKADDIINLINRPTKHK